MKKIMVAVFLFLILYQFQNISAFDSMGGVADKQAPDFTLLDLGDREVSLSDFKDKGVILFFWATWCPHCRKEISVLNTEYKKMRDSGIELIAIDINESKAKVESFVSQHSIDYPVLLDEDGSVASNYGIVGVPTLILVKKDRIISVSYFLADNYKELLSEK